MSEKGWHNPPRFFTRHTSEYMQEVTAQFFEAGLVIAGDPIPPDWTELLVDQVLDGLLPG